MKRKKPVKENESDYDSENYETDSEDGNGGEKQEK